MPMLRISMLLCALLGLCLLGTTATAQERSGQDLFEEALAYQDEGACEAAIGIFRQALARDATLIRSYFYMARCYFETGDLEQAVEHYDIYLGLETNLEASSAASKELDKVLSELDPRYQNPDVVTEPAPEPGTEPDTTQPTDTASGPPRPDSGSAETGSAEPPRSDNSPPSADGPREPTSPTRGDDPPTQIVDPKGPDSTASNEPPSESDPKEPGKPRPDLTRPDLDPNADGTIKPSRVVLRSPKARRNAGIGLIVSGSTMGVGGGVMYGLYRKRIDNDTFDDDYAIRIAPFLGSAVGLWIAGIAQAALGIPLMLISQPEPGARGPRVGARIGTDHVQFELQF